MMPLPLGKSVWKSFPSVHIPKKYSFSSAREYLELIPEVRFSELGIIVEKTQKDRRNDEEDDDDFFDYTLPTQEDRKRHFVDGTLKRADIFIDSGRVLSLEDCQKDKHYFVKGLVKASMKNLIYGVNIAISQNSGKVCLADCCCWAKALGRCAHVVAVLLLIGRHVQQQGHAGKYLFLNIYTLFSSSLNLINGHWKLTRNAQTLTISLATAKHAFGIRNLTRRNSFTLEMKRSTWTLASAIILEEMTSRAVTSVLPCAKAGMNRLTSYSSIRSSMSNPLSAITASPGLRYSKKPESSTMFLSEMFPS